MILQEIIRRKRDGESLFGSEINGIVSAITDGSATEGQIGAFAMASFIRGLNTNETVSLTTAMRDSGDVLRWDPDALGGPVLDKHSSGGIGDKVSLMLAPMVAAAGGFVPMISGRGLGHTGGTLDKLESIPGYDVSPDPQRFQKIVASVGCSIIGQTENLAPADRRLYAVRDITGTVESIPLITASILSKKLAAGLGGLVMDIKAGSGAFMSTVDDARALAQSIVNVAQGAGLPTTALVTDMGQVLGDRAGHSLEIAETVEYLTGKKRDPRLHAVVIELGAELLLTGGLAETMDDARTKLEATLATGSAAERFGRMVAEHGGPTDLLNNTKGHLAAAPITMAVHPDKPGRIEKINAREYGLIILELGGGRRTAADKIDPAVGISKAAGIGDRVDRERPIAVLHARDKAAAIKAAGALKKAVTTTDAKLEAPSALIDRIAAETPA